MGAERKPKIKMCLEGSATKIKCVGRGVPEKRKCGGGESPPKICKGVSEKKKNVGSAKEIWGGSTIFFPSVPLRISNGIALTENDSFEFRNVYSVVLFVPAIEINT